MVWKEVPLPHTIQSIQLPFHSLLYSFQLIFSLVQIGSFEFCGIWTGKMVLNSKSSGGKDIWPGRSIGNVWQQ